MSRSTGRIALRCRIRLNVSGESSSLRLHRLAGKTAKAIGITIPQSVLVRADRVIE